MTTITPKLIMDGLIEDRNNISRQVTSAVTQLKVQTDLMAGIAAYLFTEINNPNGVVDAEYIAAVTTKFQAQLVPLLTEVLPKLQAIEALGAKDVEGNPDPVAMAANLATLITDYGLNPATFANRYTD